MATTYIKSKTSHFGGMINLANLHSEIVEEPGIAQSLIGVSMMDDDVEIIFNTQLSAGEQTTLNTVISSHDYTAIPRKRNFFTILPRKEFTKTSIYETMTAFKYDGTNAMGAINYIEIIGRKDSSITSYSVRITSHTSGLVIAEKTGITTSECSVIDLGPISNIPAKPEIFELQMKRTGGKGKGKVYVDSVIVYYD